MTAILCIKRAQRILVVLAAFAVMGSAAAVAQDAKAPDDAKQSCDVPAYLLATESKLTKVEDAIKTRGKLDILVIGSRSSSLAAATGTPLSNALPNNPSSVSGPPDAAYPSRLQIFLRDKLPSIKVNVTVDVQPKKTSEEMVAELPKIVTAKTPDLVIWQTGTVDAMRSVDPDDFRVAVDEGVAAIKSSGTDIILMNLQYSPRTETMISTTPYVDNMRVVAQQHDVPLFDRFAIMREWSESGDFDLFSPSPGVNLAKRVHECLARALSTFVIDAARINPAELKVQR